MPVPQSDPEFLAMRRIIRILAPLSFGAAQRVLAYAGSRFREPYTEALQEKWGGEQVGYVTSNGVGQTNVR